MIDKAQLDVRLLAIGLTKTQIARLAADARIAAWDVLVNELNASAQAAELDRITTANADMAAAVGDIAKGLAPR